MNDGDPTEIRNDVVTTEAQSAIDETLRSLDPDGSRPEFVMESLHLELGFSGRTVLSDVNVSLKRGSITTLIGPTGSGKSTFLRTLNRMNDRVSGFSRKGDVTFDKESLWGRNVDLLTLRRRVGMLFQRPNPFPMSIKDNVVAGVKAHRIAKGKQLDVVCERRLTEVGLWDAVKDRLNDSPFRLSGGQQQLLCLARALAVGPEVLLLDEPTSALDPVTTESIEALLRTMAPALTLIVVTHNLGQARRVSHQTMFFYQGRLMEHGSTEQLFTQPTHPDTERYVTGRMGRGSAIPEHGSSNRAVGHRRAIPNTEVHTNNLTRREPVQTLKRAVQLKRGAVVVVLAGIALSSVVISSAASASVKLPSSGVETPSGGTVTETGSTLLYPLFNLWAGGYNAKFPSVTIQTAGTGSGTGISEAENGTIDIGASDAYLAPSVVSTNPNLKNIPLAISAQLVAYNVPGVLSHLKLKREARLGDLPGPGDPVERLADRKCEPRRDPAEHSDRHPAPLGQQR